MPARHWFYFVVCESDSEGLTGARVSAIEQCAATWGLHLTKREYGECVALDADTDDEDAATLFKLCAEKALFEGHPPEPNKPTNE